MWQYVMSVPRSALALDQSDHSLHCTQEETLVLSYSLSTQRVL